MKQDPSLWLAQPLIFWSLLGNLGAMHLLQYKPCNSSGHGNSLKRNAFLNTSQFLKKSNTKDTKLGENSSTLPYCPIVSFRILSKNSTYCSIYCILSHFGKRTHLVRCCTYMKDFKVCHTCNKYLVNTASFNGKTLQSATKYLLFQTENKLLCKHYQNCDS